MVNDSRIDIYNYLYGLLYNNVTKNVYSMNEPQELTQSDTTDGFIVVIVGDLNDESEFELDAYAWARVYIQAYIPPISRGRLDTTKYKAFEDGISEIIRQESEHGTSDEYWIESESVLSMDAAYDSPNNLYYMFVKSFIVVINEKEVVVQPEDDTNENNDNNDNSSDVNDNNSDNVNDGNGN